MKVLLVNNYYYNRGGDCTYMFSLRELLEQKGNKVIVFSMHQPQNFSSEYSKYFVSHIDYADELRNKNILNAFRVLYRCIYSVEAKQKIERLIKDEKPDIVHLNNIRQRITPSILYPIKKNKIPVVWTLHDYQLICPNIWFLAKGRICERCRKRKFFWPPIVRCKKDSFLASTMGAIEHAMQVILGAYKHVDYFICPSKFLRNKFIEYGFDENKLVLLQHFIDIPENNNDIYVGDYYLYVGRIWPEKGLKTLIDAVIKADKGPLKIVGEGPIMDEVVSYAAKKDRKKIVEFLGLKSRDEVIELINNSKFLVIPSEWYEVSGQVILESFMCRKPVIASRIGGMPELVKDGLTGMTFEPWNADDLCSKIKELSKDPVKIRAMGEAGRALVMENHNADLHYKKIMEIYTKARNSKNNND